MEKENSVLQENITLNQLIWCKKDLTHYEKIKALMSYITIKKPKVRHVKWNIDTTFERVKLYKIESIYTINQIGTMYDVACKIINLSRYFDRKYKLPKTFELKKFVPQWVINIWNNNFKNYCKHNGIRLPFRDINKPNKREHLIFVLNLFVDIGYIKSHELNTILLRIEEENE